MFKVTKVNLKDTYMQGITWKERIIVKKWMKKLRSNLEVVEAQHINQSSIYEHFRDREQNLINSVWALQ